MTVRVRFAPSPTGTLHIGGARTALFNWLFARHMDGEFVIRMEDTDLERSTDESVDSILEAMDWMGLTHDGEILRQSTRRDEHVKLANKLLEEGKAYKCYATPEELEDMKQKALDEGRQPKYDRRWRDGGEPPSPGASYAIRFKMPMAGSTTIEDKVLGSVTVNHEDLDDLVILRRDGTPTYNFVVVCDDAYMGISHVIRGQDHMTNTFRQAQIYKALALDIPTFGHLPLVDGLSKRKGSRSVQHYRDEGYLKEALINYIARLGWSHGDQEIFTPEELIELFELSGVNRSSSTYDDSKMRWVNTEWLSRLEAETLGDRLRPHLESIGISTDGQEQRLSIIADLYRERAETLSEMAESVRYFFEPPDEYNAKAMKKWLKPGARQGFSTLIKRLEELETFDVASIDTVIRKTLDDFELGYIKLAQPCRIAVSGNAATPSIDATLAAIGHDEVIQRLQKLLEVFPQEDE